MARSKANHHGRVAAAARTTTVGSMAATPAELADGPAECTPVDAVRPEQLQAVIVLPDRRPMRIEVSPEAVGHVMAAGGVLWVWAAYPRRCCAGTPAYMHAATSRPRMELLFRKVPHPDLEIWFRGPGGRDPDVLAIGVHGRRKPKVEAYWDGCLFAMS